MDDLVRQILAAIEKLEAAALAVRDAPSDITVILRPGAPQPTELEKLALKHRLERQDRERQRQADPVRALLQEQAGWETVLRRCAADRKLLDLHEQVPTHEGSTETGCKLCLWEYSWGCDVQAGICETVKIVAEGYGINQEAQQ